MKPDRTVFEKDVHRHLSLLGSPSVSQVEVSRGRVLERLRVRHQAAESSAPPAVGAASLRYAWLPMAAAAALIVVIGGVMLWPRGVQAYAAGEDGLQVTLADDSRVEMRAHAEMTVARESDGIQIDLKTGDIIVSAADQRDGHLSVRTGDMTIDLFAGARTDKADGTVFLASAGQQGSRVGVIEGEVRVREVREGSVETLVRPGEQIATSPVLAARSVRDDITWSRNANEHLAKVDLFLRGVAQTTASLTPLARQADVPGASTFALGASADRQTPGAKAAPLEFEEASIRPCDPDNLPPGAGGRGGGGPNSLYMTPGRLYVLCMTPATLIRTAYGYRSVNQEVEMGWYINPEAPGRMEPIGAGAVYTNDVEDGRRVRGGPDWVRTEKYTIEAVAEGLPADQNACAPIAGRANRPPNQPRPPGMPCRTANAASMSGPMLRALLERRFGLKAHIVTEQTTAYDLVIAPSGLKMKEGTCTPDPSVSRLGSDMVVSRQIVDVARRNLDAARRGDATTGLCGNGVADNGPNRVIVGAGTPGAGVANQPGFARLLRGILGAPVTDRTGIPDTKRFNYALEFLRDERTKNPFYVIFPAGMDMQIAADPSSVQPAPNLLTALEQQLGLRLEPAQLPRDYIVIDAIKRLEPN